MNIFELACFLLFCFTGFTFGAALAGVIGVVGWFIGLPTGFLFSLACYIGYDRFPTFFERTRMRGGIPSNRDNFIDLAIVATNCLAAYYGGRLLSGALRGAGWLVGAHLGFLGSQLCIYGLVTFWFLLEDRRRGTIAGRRDEP